MKRGIEVKCRACMLPKKPRGRSMPMGMSMCAEHCTGYPMDPKPGDLWPGETEANFGPFPVSDHATETLPEDLRMFHGEDDD